MERGDFPIKINRQHKSSGKTSCWPHMLKWKKKIPQNIQLNHHCLLIDDKYQVEKTNIFFTYNKAQPSSTTWDVEVRQKPDVQVSTCIISVAKDWKKNTVGEDAPDSQECLYMLQRSVFPWICMARKSNACLQKRRRGSGSLAMVIRNLWLLKPQWSLTDGTEDHPGQSLSLW